jgi:hypothetical protein
MLAKARCRTARIKLMSWITRSATAAVLVVALAALPLVLDQCVAACEAQHAAVTSAPACHHTNLAKNPTAPTPASCGHDHDGTVGTAGSRTAAPMLAFNSMIAVLVVPAAPTGIAADRSTLTHGPPGSPLSLDSRLLPLRI